jgi:hypothetical protein
MISINTLSLVFYLLRGGINTNVISTGISKDIIKSIRFGYILRCFTNNDDQLSFIVWEVIFGWLSHLRDDNSGQRSDESCDGFAKQEGESVVIYGFISKKLKDWMGCTQTLEQAFWLQPKNAIYA